MVHTVVVILKNNIRLAYGKLVSILNDIEKVIAYPMKRDEIPKNKQEFYRGALNYYTEACKIDPYDPEILNNEKLALEKLGSILDDVKKDVVISRKRDGNTYYQKGLYQEALNCFNKALQIDPDDQELLTNKEQTLEKLGNNQNGEKKIAPSMKPDGITD